MLHLLLPLRPQLRKAQVPQQGANSACARTPITTMLQHIA